MLEYLTAGIPAVVTVLYALTALCHAAKGEFTWAMVWGSYATANVGLILASKN